MQIFLQRIWRNLLITGILSLVFGLLALVMPGITLITLAWMFGFSVIGQGILLLGGAWSARKLDGGWWLVALLGLIGIVLGLYAIWNPGLTALVLVTIIGWFAILVGLVQVAWAWRVRKAIQGEGWIIAGGLLSILFGLYVIAQPGAGALALVVVIAVYAITYGITLIAAAMKAKRLRASLAERR